MKNRTVKIISASLAAVLLGSTAVYALAGSEENNAGSAAVTSSETSSEKITARSTAGEGKKGAYKEESVYVLAGADGSVQRVIVSDWLKNPDGGASLPDRSNLTDIENVKGDEGYTASGQALTWQADGGDIYYRGESAEPLPIDIAIRYQLDGCDISPDELAGKSGHVTIRFDYTNHLTENAVINGKTEKIPVPFAVLTAALLDDEVFSNVTVTNGRLVNDGSRSVAVGLAFPGLNEALDLDALAPDGTELPELPEFVTISADVRNFSFGMTVSVATDSVFAGLDTEKLDLGDLTDAADALTDAMEQLVDGSSRLADGLDALYDKSGELTDGIDRLAEGSETLADGAAELNEGAGTLRDGADALNDGLGTLRDGAGELNAGAVTLRDGAVTLDRGAAQLLDGTDALSAGLSALDANRSALTDGAKQVFGTLLATAQSQLTAAGLDVPLLTMENYGKVLTDAASSLNEDAVYQLALGTVTAAVNEKRDYIESEVTKAVEAEVEAKVADTVRETVEDAVIQQALGMSGTDYEAAVKAGRIDAQAQAGIKAAVEAQMRSDEVKARIAEKTDEQMASDAVKSTVQSKTEEQTQKAIEENMAGDEVRAKLAAAASGRESLASLKASLDRYAEFYEGILAYTAGVAQAADGADSLKTGMTELKTGTEQLADGSAALKTGADTLVNGAAELKNGAQRLADGANTLKDGTEQLSDGANELKDGIGTLKSGTPALIEGITELRDGARELADGLETLNEEGIGKLTDLLNSGMDDRLRAIIDAAKTYRNYSGLADGTDGTVKFIWRTDGIGA